MTEEDWMEDRDLRAVHHLVGLGLATDRKLWLLSAGQCRCLWRLLEDWEEETVELAERCAEGQVGRRELERRFHQIEDRPIPENAWWHHTRFCLKQVAHTDRLVKKGGYESWQGTNDEDGVGTPGRAALVSPVNSFVSSAEFYAGGNSFAMQQRVYAVFRNLFGNPFRPVTIEPAWLAGPVRNWPGRLIETAPSSGCPSWPRPWSAPAAPARTSSSIAGRLASMFAAAGRSARCSAENEASGVATAGVGLTTANDPGEVKD